jgi:hypothetical protein
VTPVASPDAMARLAAFADRLLAANPFTDNRVNGAATAADVGAVHQAAFDRLTALAREARDTHRGLGAVLWGEAGVGKSHVLARLARWADDEQACFVLLHNLSASPANLPRAVLRSTVSQLSAGPSGRFHNTPLFHLVLSALAEALRHDTAGIHAWPAAEAGYRRFVADLRARHPARADLVDPTAYQVLFRFLQSAVRTRRGNDDGLAALAVRWLGGDALDPADARRLGLPPGRPGEPAALADAQQIKGVLVALTQLARCRRQPFVLAFDQADNLDADQAAALARFLEALLDAAPNLLAVTAGVQATLVRWRQDRVFQDSAWDRLAQFEVPLVRVSPAEARQIVGLRLEPVVEPFVGLDPVRQRLLDDELFPLGRAWADDFLRDRIDVRPRDVLSAAREAWRRQQERLGELGVRAWLDRWSADGSPPSVPAPDQVERLVEARVLQKLAEHVAEVARRPELLPPDGDRLLTQVYALLRKCVGPTEVVRVDRVPVPKNAPRPACDLLVTRRAADGTDERIGLAFVVTSSGQSATAYLRRLTQEAAHQERRLLVTDARQPLPVAARGSDYLATLRDGRRFAQVELTPDEVAELDGLHAVVGLARSGDLEADLPGGRPRSISEVDAVAVLHRHGRLRSAPVLREVFTGSDRK